MKTNYKELIEKLNRTGQFYYPSHQSDLYFQAARAIEQLLSERLTLKERIKLIFTHARNK